MTTEDDVPAPFTVKLSALRIRALDAPLTSVRASTARVVRRAQHVHIDSAALAALTRSLTTRQTQPLAWQELGWHYHADAETAGPLTCQYALVLDALNFCFWPTPGLEYEHLARGLRRALERDPTAFNAQALASVSPATVAGWVDCPSPPSPSHLSTSTPPTGPGPATGARGTSPPSSPASSPPSSFLPCLSERVRKVREVGHVLLQHFNGQAADLVRASGFSAVELVRLLSAFFPSFRDEALHQGEQVYFYKRAQILVADIWAAYGCRTDPPFPYAFRDMGELTMFADYRVPQILRGRGVLRYAPGLAERVDGREELPAGSEEEVEIRAATVQAVESMREVWRAGGKGEILSVELDWLLWQEGERYRDSLPPHHRTLSIFY
ncbi:hypothetical protein NSK_008190 [Nannochloropsis salina CCMP1776]|uniref:Queuosine 5'-phosphate N-glycosylase/hydrolase n=1 Tax=Nannochloropsis salina CCMP1776 TaxID=1027361 RepID=A0A4D9CUX0_9STRA|nr:hypothetical protein NSK_008190 [Nannochloropsis salina CCMP1776]|eukprot:TFJ80449.1 hypothetical protein NSK_008190 [Nannochloropsis salina CCMP1776]